MIYFAILKLVKLNVVNDGFWLVETIYSALQLENGELLLVVSPQFNANAIQDYALRWEMKPYSVVSKDAGLILKIRA